MRRAMPVAIALLIAASAIASAPSPAAAVTAGVPSGPGTEDATRMRAPLSAAGRFIVLLRPGKSLGAATGRAARLGVTMDRTFSHAVRGYAARLDPDQVASLREDPEVEAVVPDEVISIAGQSVPTGVRRINGRESLVAGIDGKDGPDGSSERVDADVAIVDTGIDKNHADLNVAGGINCSTSNPNAWGDGNGHGTHVAGTVGAIDDGIGVVGTAPGVRLWAVRILDSAGNGLVSWYVCGLDWITAQRDPADPTRPLFEAVNMSVAKTGTDDHNCGLTNKDLIHQAICRLTASGVTVVAAAGNNGFNAAKLKPASYNEVITVSALADTDGKPGGLGGPLCYSWGSYDQDDTFANFSNYGGDVDLIAPGKCIWSTLPGGRYGYISGTSMAAPHVTGAVALYKASRPLATPAQVRVALRAAGNLDWKTSTDPDSVHEPLLDVSHIVALGDFTVDATPGTSHGALVGGAGGSLQLPVALVRAEDVPGEIGLSVAVRAPLSATLADSALGGLSGIATSMTVNVPPATPDGTYSITVTATDGTRRRSSSFPLIVDGVAPTASAPRLALQAGSLLRSSAVGATGTWAAASDPGGSIASYQVRWRVDGTLGSATSLSSSARKATRTVAIGHTYSLRIRARDRVGNWSAWVETARFAPARSQDRSPTLIRSAGWARYRASSMSGGSSLYSRTKGAMVRRPFTGRAIALVTSKSPKRGKAKIYIDGSYVTTVDLRRSSTKHRVLVFARAWASPGKHTLGIKVVGTPGRRRVDVDAFIIVP